MMKILEEAIIYATVMHQGMVRKIGNGPYILHPLEVAQIISTITDDDEVITAGILHDIVEDTDITLPEIEKRFGKRVAELVASESETKSPREDKRATWKRRKEESLKTLRNSTDPGVKILWLADKLSNIRSLAGKYSEEGDGLWNHLNQSDPEEHRWYYQSIAEIVELSLNKTGAFKEFIKHINFIWPGTFDSEKARYRKYRDVSLQGYQPISRGAKGEVYRYDDELIIKVFNQNNTYSDVEREIALSRKAFILGIPTAISFGIVTVGERYGAMYELLDCETLSWYIAKAPGQVRKYAELMANLAREIHGISADDTGIFPEANERMKAYIKGGIAREDERLGERCLELLATVPETDRLIHGDFHSGNVLLQNGEPLLIDMDRIARGHPIVEISDMYYFYVILGEDDPGNVERFMGFSYETARAFYQAFLKCYLGTEEEERLSEVTKKASLLGYTRAIRRLRKKQTLTGEEERMVERYIAAIADLCGRLETLAF